MKLKNCLLPKIKLFLSFIILIIIPPPSSSTKIEAKPWIRVPSGRIGKPAIKQPPCHNGGLSYWKTDQTPWKRGCRCPKGFFGSKCEKWRCHNFGSCVGISVLSSAQASGIGGRNESRHPDFSTTCIAEKVVEANAFCDCSVSGTQGRFCEEILACENDGRLSKNGKCFCTAKFQGPTCSERKSRRKQKDIQCPESFTLKRESDFHIHCIPIPSETTYDSENLPWAVWIGLISVLIISLIFLILVLLFKCCHKDFFDRSPTPIRILFKSIGSCTICRRSVRMHTESRNHSVSEEAPKPYGDHLWRSKRDFERPPVKIGTHSTIENRLSSVQIFEPQL